MAKKRKNPTVGRQTWVEFSPVEVDDITGCTSIGKVRILLSSTRDFLKASPSRSTIVSRAGQKGFDALLGQAKIFAGLQSGRTGNPRSSPYSWASARNGKWHRTVTEKPSWTRDETALCGITFRPVNVTWSEEPPTTERFKCKHCLVSDTASRRGDWKIIDRSTGLYWSNADGWVSKGTSDTFSDAEKAKLNLPVGGEWSLARRHNVDDEGGGAECNCGLHDCRKCNAAFLCCDGCRSGPGNAPWCSNGGCECHLCEDPALDIEGPGGITPRDRMEGRGGNVCPYCGEAALITDGDGRTSCSACREDIEPGRSGNPAPLCASGTLADREHGPGRYTYPCPEHGPHPFCERCHWLLRQEQFGGTMEKCPVRFREAISFDRSGNPNYDYEDGSEAPSCPACGGPGNFLGTLGRLEHFRCRNCAMDFHREANPGQIQKIEKAPQGGWWWKTYTPNGREVPLPWRGPMWIPPIWKHKYTEHGTFTTREFAEEALRAFNAECRAEERS